MIIPELELATDRPAVAPLATAIVHGIPKTKGSMRHIGGGRMQEQVVGSKAWRQHVATELRAAYPHPAAYDGPVGVTMLFNFPRPVAARTRPWPHTKATGDLDKLYRNIGDAMQDAGVVTEDSRIVEARVRKTYAGPGEATGAIITVWRIEDYA
jgi:Holliday junction resolvase RusA-like endonuclease